MRNLALSMPIYAAGAGGIPATSALVAPNILRKANSITWSITDQCGFESCDVTFTGTVAEAQYWFNNLIASTVVYAPTGEICWEGLLNQVDLSIAGETHSRSLDGMQNRMKVRYSTVLGGPGVSPTYSDTTSQGLYGIKDGVERVGELTATTAAAQAQRILADRKDPVRHPSSQLSTSDSMECTITLHFVGWYVALDWLVTAVTTTTTAVTTTQVTTLMTAYNAVNAFFSTSTLNITASGISESQFIADDTTYRSAIEKLLNVGNSSNQRFAWGVYENRELCISVWAGATPTTVTYRKSMKANMITNTGNAPVSWWRIRPNAIVEINELLDITPSTTQVDAAARYYVARTTFSADDSGMNISLEPSDYTDVSAQIARLTYTR